MSCRHSEIRECENDIKKLAKTGGCIPDINKVNTEIKTELDSIATLCETTFESSGISQIQEALRKLPDDFQNHVNEEKRKIENSKSKIRLKKTEYQREDEWYHEAEDDDD